MIFWQCHYRVPPKMFCRLSDCYQSGFVVGHFVNHKALLQLVSTIMLFIWYKGFRSILPNTCCHKMAILNALIIRVRHISLTNKRAVLQGACLDFSLFCLCRIDMLANLQTTKWNSIIQLL